MMIKSAGNAKGWNNKDIPQNHHEITNNLVKRYEPGGTFEAVKQKLIMKYTMRHATNAQPEIGNEHTPRSAPYLSRGPTQRRGTFLA
ncbi:hypothetical protein R1flu_011235 [Riccia fluitans]|uniref:Uncharacterized protein n=1 Tax=Riccia fluitans TaxID=41844 RepID=A0ABD1Z789_9MARC